MYRLLFYNLFHFGSLKMYRLGRIRRKLNFPGWRNTECHSCVDFYQNQQTDVRPSKPRIEILIWVQSAAVGIPWIGSKQWQFSCNTPACISKPTQSVPTISDIWYVMRIFDIVWCLIFLDGNSLGLMASSIMPFAKLWGKCFFGQNLFHIIYIKSLSEVKRTQ